MDTPSQKDLRDAREQFDALLSRRTLEAEWQTFFTDHPYVLSLSLPLRLQPRDIIPMGRHGRTEPDFLFYPRHLAPPPFYGVIELKRPDSPIVTVTRQNVARLTGDA